MHRWLRSALVVSSLAGCAHGGEPAQRPAAPATATASATIDNSLPADGCSFVVQINGTDYAPDAKSLAAIRERNLPFGKSTVKVDYTLTGRNGTVECGFNTHRELPEITVVVKDS